MNTPTPPAPKFVLTIVLMDNGRLTINGPINDKALCYGMLELAKDAVRAFEAPRILPANVLPFSGKG